MTHDASYVVEIQEDVASGELYVAIPETIINNMGWYEGTELIWVLENDEIILREKNP